MKAIVTLDPVSYSTPVVTLVLAKANANIQYADQDDLLTLFLHASIEAAEQYTGTIIQERNATIQLKSFSEFVYLPNAPLTQIASVVYKNLEGESITLSAAEYETVREGYGLRFKQTEFPELEKDNAYPITIIGAMGYTSASVPINIKSAILLKFAHKELFREDTPRTGSDRSFYAALRPYKIW
jgi:uncharacterized phiE125 gp8 family phage protein